MKAMGAKTILKYNKADKKTGYAFRLEISVSNNFSRNFGEYLLGVY